MLRRFVFIFLVLILPAAPAAAALQNELADNPSPYLAMHGDDPVAWQEWGSPVVERARRENKLLFISVGYFSCHWCHVMQRESFSDAAIASALNDDFIPVKVDRELNPALDAHLIEFVQRTRGHAGWPLNVFITPEGHPLVGMVYLPPADFRATLEQLQEAWRSDADELRALAQRASAALASPEVGPDPDLEDGIGRFYDQALVKNALDLADDVSGGFGDQNKFPQAPQLRALLDALARDPDPRLREFLVQTLDAMMQRGLHDLLGGGFYRYTVDPGWHIPHFEKMLYDNALLVDIYLRAARVLGLPRYEQQARRTLDFMLAELMLPGRAMVASLSAVDENNVEGGYYLWDTSTLESLLSAEENRAVQLAWGMRGPPSLDEGHLPIQELTATQVAAQLQTEPAAVDGLLESARVKLLKARDKRRVPVDDKLLAAWNGLALAALAQGAALPGAERYREAARQVRDYLLNELWDGEQLLRARSSSGAIGHAGLEDYAYVAAGLFAWAQLTGSAADYELVQEILDQAWRRFYGERGWRLSERMLIAYGGSEAVIADGPLPSPSAVLLETSLRLAVHRGDAQAERRAIGVLNTGHASVIAEPFWYASHVAVIAAYQGEEF